MAGITQEQWSCSQVAVPRRPASSPCPPGVCAAPQGLFEKAQALHMAERHRPVFGPPPGSIHPPLPTPFSLNFWLCSGIVTENGQKNRNISESHENKRPELEPSVQTDPTPVRGQLCCLRRDAASEEAGPWQPCWPTGKRVSG